MSTPSGPYDPTPPPSGAEPYPGEYPQNPPAYPQYPAQPGAYNQPAPGVPVYPQQPYGQQPYGQQPYGQQAYAPQAYPGYPPPQPRTNSHRTLWIILGVVGGVLVLACFACAGLVFFLGSQVANNPLIASTITASQFCADEQRQRYTNAYQLLSANMQTQVSQDRFAQDNQNSDTANGTVSACNVTPTDQSAQSQSSATSVSFLVTVTRGASGGATTGASGTSSSGTVTVVKENGSWKIDSVDSSLGLT